MQRRSGDHRARHALFIETKPLIDLSVIEFLFEEVPVSSTIVLGLVDNRCRRCGSARVGFEPLGIENHEKSLRDIRASRHTQPSYVDGASLAAQRGGGSWSMRFSEGLGFLRARFGGCWSIGPLYAFAHLRWLHRSPAARSVS